MDISILRISPQGYLLFFMVFSSIIFILVFIVYALLCSGKFRRQQFREGGKLSKVSALLIVTPLVLVSLSYIYSDSWGYFYTLESNAKTIDIGYYYPERRLALSKADIVVINVTSHIRKGGTQYRLIIRTKDGDEYMSQLISHWDIGSIIELLENELNIKVKI